MIDNKTWEQVHYYHGNYYSNFYKREKFRRRSKKSLSCFPCEYYDKCDGVNTPCL